MPTARCQLLNVPRSHPRILASSQLYEFLNVVTRISFWRLNPEFGELTMEHQDSILPVPECLEKALTECVLPNAHRDDAAEFRAKTMQMPEVQAALAEGRPRLQAWFATIPLDENQRVGITQWVATLTALNVLGTFTCTQGSDIVGDDRVGTEFKSRLSVPQAKAAFVNAQKETGGAVGESSSFFCVSLRRPPCTLPPSLTRPPGTHLVDDVTLDFDELLECIARCGVDKYRTIKQMPVAEKVAAMTANILGDLNEEQVITAGTYITAERFTPTTAPPKGVAPDVHKEWLMIWEMLQLSTVHGFPLWEKDVYDILASKLESLRSIFKAYAAGSVAASGQASGSVGANMEMDMEEFHDFVMDANVLTKFYGFDAVSGQVSRHTPLHTIPAPCLLSPGLWSSVSAHLCPVFGARSSQNRTRAAM